MAEVLPPGQAVGVPATRSLDVLGFLCPVPVARTRMALKEVEPGEVLEVWADDWESLHDIPILCARLKVELLSVEEQAGALRFLIRRLQKVGR